MLKAAASSVEVLLKRWCLYPFLGTNGVVVDQFADIRVEMLPEPPSIFDAKGHWDLERFEQRSQDSFRILALDVT